MTKGHVLIADDEASIRRFLRGVLEDEGFLVYEAKNGEDALKLLGQREFSLVISDLKMGGINGLEVLSRLRKMGDQTPFIILTAYGNIPSAVEAMKKGALDFLEKPLPGPETIRNLAKKAMETSRLNIENQALKRGQPKPDLIAQDPAMKKVLNMARKAAGADITVLLTGPSGAGKEVIARFIHNNSKKNSGPFVGLNCAALPENLLESELFGYEKGAFSGADRRKPGLAELASTGTLFLDEIAEAGPDVQAKLLRVIETREFYRLGGSRLVTTDARFVAATNRDLRAEVAAGRFRQDLYYRLGVFPIVIPPLSDRPGDILPLTRHFLTRFGRKYAHSDLKLAPKTEKLILDYDWPGNVRELANTLERAALLCEDGIIQPHELLIENATGSSGGRLKDLEREAIVQALNEFNGNRKQTAKRLGISVRTLQYRLKEYEIS